MKITYQIDGLEKINWKRDAVYATLTAIILGVVLYAAVTSSLTGGGGQVKLEVVEENAK